MINKKTARSYQNEAIDNWRRNSYKGLFEMATGTGKTFTSLKGAVQLLELQGSLVVIILVPTLDLANQWATEVSKILTNEVILANSKNKDWHKEAVVALHRKAPTFTIIATYATFLTVNFQHIVSLLPEKTLLIADEAHNFGTKKHIALYPENIPYRLGLSATPDRYFDEEGSEAVYKYFNAAANTTFVFSMEQAISEGFLCEYYYYPKLVSLGSKELESYKEISRKLMRYFDAKTGQLRDNLATSTLLLKRKRIIHQAANKIGVFREILMELTQRFHPLKYLLVYVPEGKDSTIDQDDRRLIDQYSRIVAREFKLSQHQFIGETDSRSEVLRQFATGEIAVLTAMKCLDEGVDIRRAEIAIFCSSTGNPRQFIQRRGRILRTHPEKKFATIYDLVVVPEITDQYFEDTLTMEKSILRSELTRVHEFASLALNRYQALAEVDQRAKDFGIDIFSRTQNV